MDNFYYVSIIFIQTTPQLNAESHFCYCLFDTVHTCLFDTVNIPYTQCCLLQKAQALRQISEILQLRNFSLLIFLHITYKINKFSVDMHFKLFSVSKSKTGTITYT